MLDRQAGRKEGRQRSFYLEGQGLGFGCIEVRFSSLDPETKSLGLEVQSLGRKAEATERQAIIKACKQTNGPLLPIVR